MNTRWIAVVTAAACALTSAPALAALKPGDAAPPFAADAALGGATFHFSLAEALRQGPVVLYFYPKSFTSGCTVEAHLFADATPKFKALGATVIGVSHDDLDTQKKFSTEGCRDQFAVAADPDSAIARAYDAKMFALPMASRISYVITPDGRIASVYDSMDPSHHVEQTLKTVEDWRATHPR